MGAKEANIVERDWWESVVDGAKHPGSYACKAFFWKRLGEQERNIMVLLGDL